MITDAVLNFFGVIVDGLLALLPAWSQPTIPWDSIIGEITYYNSILPVLELYWIVNLVLLFTAAMFAYYVLMWVVKRLTFSG